MTVPALSSCPAVRFGKTWLAAKMVESKRIKVEIVRQIEDREVVKVVEVQVLKVLVVAIGVLVVQLVRDPHRQSQSDEADEQQSLH